MALAWVFPAVRDRSISARSKSGLPSPTGDAGFENCDEDVGLKRCLDISEVSLDNLPLNSQSWNLNPQRLAKGVGCSARDLSRPGLPRPTGDAGFENWGKG